LSICNQSWIKARKEKKRKGKEIFHLRLTDWINFTPILTPWKELRKRDMTRDTIVTSTMRCCLFFEWKWKGCIKNFSSVSSPKDRAMFDEMFAVSPLHSFFFFSFWWGRRKFRDERGYSIVVFLFPTLVVSNLVQVTRVVVLKYRRWSGRKTNLTLTCVYSLSGCDFEMSVTS